MAEARTRSAAPLSAAASNARHRGRRRQGASRRQPRSRNCSSAGATRRWRGWRLSCLGMARHRAGCPRRYGETPGRGRGWRETACKDDPGDSPEPSTALAIIEPTAVAIPADTYVMPALIADLGEQAGWRYVEFFTANIRNPHTRRAYARACSQFFAWCEQRGLWLPLGNFLCEKKRERRIWRTDFAHGQPADPRKALALASGRHVGLFGSSSLDCLFQGRQFAPPHSLTSSMQTIWITPIREIPQFIPRPAAVGGGSNGGEGDQPRAARRAGLHGLCAGGRWIRTLGSARDRLWFRRLRPFLASRAIARMRGSPANR